MIDLIIPYYNNPQGLKQTLDSINTDIFYITIVDDGSNIYMPYDICANQVFRYNANHGPGFARQFGLDRTHNPYVMFIDTGDVFISKEIQEEIPIMINNSDTNILVWPYYYQDKITDRFDNRMHGKLYKREFIEKYNITFCQESSYLNEDIGFNCACRIISKSIGKEFIFIENEPIIRQIEDNNSLTNKDNKSFMYQNQTRALALNAIHAIEIARENYINPLVEIHQFIASLYYWFIMTSIKHPEFINNAWAGVKIFYNYCASDINLDNITLNNFELKKLMQYKQLLKVPINLPRFINDIQQNENCPSYYLT